MRRKKTDGRDLVVWLASFGLSLVLFWASWTHSEGISERQLIQVGIHTFVFGVLGFLMSTKYFPEKRSRYLSVALVVLVLVEATQQNSHHFSSWKSDEVESKYLFNTQTAVDKLLQSHNLKKWDLRERESSGLFTGIGVATVDNGAPPIQTLRLTELRKALFHFVLPAPDAAAPFSYGKYSYSFPLIGTNLYWPLDPHPVSNESWVKLGSAGGRTLYLDKTSLGRAYLAETCTAVSTWEESKLRISDPLKMQLGHAVLELSGAAEIDFCLKHRGSLRRLSLTYDKGNVLEVEEFMGPAVLVLNDNFYPGWKAIDVLSGQPLPIYPANLGFRSVILRENRPYRILFSYSPYWLPIAWGLIALALAIVIGLGIKS